MKARRVASSLLAKGQQLCVRLTGACSGIPFIAAAAPQGESEEVTHADPMEYWLE